MTAPIKAKEIAAAQIAAHAAEIELARAETAEQTSVYFLHSMLRMIEHLAGGNKLFAGRAFDEALTAFLSDVQAELGEEASAMAARLLISNLALFLDEAKRNAIFEVLK